jgi:hypothetical protein
MRESLTAVQPLDRSSGHRAIEKYDRLEAVWHWYE